MKPTTEEILQQLYDSEIHLRMGWMWDGGVDYSFGTTSNDLWDSNYNTSEIHHTGITNISEAVKVIATHASELYPHSTFAKWYKDVHSLDNLEEGDVLVNKQGYEYVVTGHVGMGESVFLKQNLSGAPSYIREVEELERCGYTLKPPTPTKWEPKVGEDYWYVDSTGGLRASAWVNDEIDNARRNFLGIYPIRKQAQEALDAVLKVLAEHKEKNL